MPPEIDPTQQGGQDEEIKPTINPRNAAMAQIAQAAHNSVKGELAGFNEDTGEVEPSPATVEAPAPVTEAPETQEAAPVTETPAQIAAPQAPRMLTIIVDGQPIEVEESRIMEAGKRTLQKDHAADRRLQEAVQTKRQADELLARAQRLSNPDAADQEPTPSQDASPQPARQQAFDPAALATYVDNQLYMRDAEKAAAKFWKDFPDIASDPYLKSMAINLENQRLSTATALGERFGDPAEAYQKHGETIKKWLAERTGQAAPVQTMADKKEAKRTITAIPAVNAKAPAPQPAKVLSTAELIEQMRENRGKGRPSMQRLQ
jgi:hypothetical protein